MSLSQKFAAFRRETALVGRALDSMTPRAKRKRSNRWNSIGHTRTCLADLLTAHVRSLIGGDGKTRYPDAVVLPKNVKPMRLVGKVREWEDAFSWEAHATWPDGGNACSFYSFDTMTACVKAGKITPVGRDGEVGAHDEGAVAVIGIE